MKLIKPVTFRAAFFFLMFAVAHPWSKTQSAANPAYMSRVVAPLYVIARKERATEGPRRATTLLLYVSTEPENIDAAHLVMIACSIKRKFKKETRITIGFFDDYEAAAGFDSSKPAHVAALRGDYSLDRDNAKESLIYSPTRDYSTNPKGRVEVKNICCDNSLVLTVGLTQTVHRWTQTHTDSMILGCYLCLSVSICG